MTRKEGRPLTEAKEITREYNSDVLRKLDSAEVVSGFISELTPYGDKNLKLFFRGKDGKIYKLVVRTDFPITLDEVNSEEN